MARSVYRTRTALLGGGLLAISAAAFAIGVQTTGPDLEALQRAAEVRHAEHLEVDRPEPTDGFDPDLVADSDELELVLASGCCPCGQC